MKQQLLIILLLVCVVFVVGVLVGYGWHSGGASGFSKVLRQSELSAESFFIEQDLFKSFETNCELANKRLSSLSEELWNLGKVLGGPEARTELGEDYDFLKRKYHLMQIRTYVLYKKLQEDCQGQIDVVLFYFKQNDPLSEQQGKILDALVEKYDLNVFAIEYNYSKELEFLEDYYEITGAPVLVVNFDNKLVGVSDEDKIAPLLHG
jgi:hypothetical protein